MSFTINRKYHDYDRGSGKLELEYISDGWVKHNDWDTPPYLSFIGAHACCGSRSLSNMSALTTNPEFGTVDGLKQLIRVLNQCFYGGNVTFVLNASQRAAFERNGILKNMNSIGQGLVEVPFRNFNMANTNYLYNWTFKGRKKKKEEVV